jgi:transcriptional regulator with XRE-family HTH domain
LEAPEAFGLVLRTRRLDAGLTQEQLAFEAEIQRVYVSKLELGQYQPTLTMLLTLAKALDCAASDLVVEVEQQLANARRAHSAFEPRRSRRNNPRAELSLQLCFRAWRASTAIPRQAPRCRRRAPASVALAPLQQTPLLQPYLQKGSSRPASSAIYSVAQAERRFRVHKAKSDSTHL